MASENIFISAVSSEFADVRKALRHAFGSRRRTVKIQNHSEFKKEGGTTIQHLADLIRDCEVVIHLIGNIAGGGSRKGRLNPEAIRRFRQDNPDLYGKLCRAIGNCETDWAAITWTQLEAYLAFYLPSPPRQRRKLLIAVAEGAPAPGSESQIAHLNRLKQIGLFPDIQSFSDAKDLENQIWQRHAEKRLFEQPIRPRDVSRMPKTYTSRSGQHAIDDHTRSAVFGRLDEQQIIDEAWKAEKTKVLGFVAGGGVGKSTLVMDWLSSFEPGEPVSIFAFSFYLQGQSERQVDTDTFLDAVSEYFEIDIDARASQFAKGKAIATQIMQERALIVLDGLEPLQEASTGRFRDSDANEKENRGSFTDNGARGFIETLANGDHFEGLCILTSRISFTDLQYLTSGRRYVEHELKGLKEEDGAAFLSHLGVLGTQDERKKISRELDGHALALLLTGTMIRDRYEGQIVAGIEPEAKEIVETLGGVIDQQNEGVRHTFKALANYENWFEQDGLFLELELLHILGLFDRAAEIEAIDAVRRRPVIAGLTDHTAAAKRQQIGQGWERLRQAGLVLRKADDSEGAVNAIDAHPLVRQYFSRRLRNREGGVPFREGHERLYLHYSEETPELPDNRWSMALLYRTISHCCLAGKMTVAFQDLLERRAWRSHLDADERNYATRQLGMISADFVALCQFYEGENIEDIRVHPDIKGKSRFTLLTDTAVRMRSLGRLRGAKNCLQEALKDFRVELMAEGYNGAYAAAQLSELQLISGELRQAEKTARQSVEYADNQNRTFFKFHSRTSLADVLMQQGNLAAADELFKEAKAIAESDPDVYPPFLYSQTCYRYGLFLIENGREDELIEISRNTEHWGEQRPWRKKTDGRVLKGSLLSAGIDSMILAEALVRRDEKRRRFCEETARVVGNAISQLTESGYSDYLARGLAIASRYFTGKGQFPEAAKALEQSREHVKRGGMRLLEADYMIEACRFYLAKDDIRQAEDSCNLATDLCDRIGYKRRAAEIVAFRKSIAQKTRAAFRQRTM